MHLTFEVVCDNNSV